MITDDDVMRLFEEADPARSDDDPGSFLETARHLHAVGTTTVEVPPAERLPSATATRRRWRPVVGVAAAVALIAAGAAVLVAGHDSSPKTLVAAGASPNAEQAEEVARGFLDAYGAFDTDRAMTYLTKRAVADEWGTSTAFRRELAFLQATGWKQTIFDPYTLAHAGDVPPPTRRSDGCEVFDFVTNKKQAAAGRLTVHCAYGYHALRSDALGQGPYSDSYWVFVVDNGRIVSADNRIDAGLINHFAAEMWRPFRRWVSSAYPRDAAVMYQGTKRSAWNWKHGEESIRLWDQRTREYVAIGEPYLARAEAICAAAHDRFEATAGPPPTGPFDANADAYEAYDAISARVLEEALAELRAVPPPDAFGLQFQQAYELGDNLVGLLRDEPVDGDIQGTVHAFGSQPGLHECRMIILGG